MSNKMKSGRSDGSKEHSQGYTQIPLWQSQHPIEKKHHFSRLMRAAIKQDVSLLKRMLETVTLEDLLEKDDKGRTAMDWARIKGNMESVRLLTEAMSLAMSVVRMESTDLEVSEESVNKSRNIQLTIDLTTALNENNIEGALKVLLESYLPRSLLKDYPDEVYFADVQTLQGDTPLIRASGLNMVEVVKQLIALEVDINHANQYGHTAFTMACLCGNADIVKFLLHNSIHYTHQTVERKTGLHYACLYNHPRVIATIFDYLCAQFCEFRAPQVPFTKYDLLRWTKFIENLECFIYCRDDNNYTALELVSDRIRKIKTEELNVLKDRDVIVLENPEEGDLEDGSIKYCQPCDPTLNGTSMSNPHENILSKDIGYMNPNKAAMEELNAIKACFDTLNDRIARWKETSARENEMAQPVSCWNGCGYTSRFEDMTKHVREACSHKRVVCAKCHEVILHKDLTQHHKLECPKRLLGCPNAWQGCTELLYADYLNTHINLRCQYRLANCRLQCGTKLPLIKREDHEQTHCKKRDIACEKCSQQIPSEQMKTHLHEHCPKRLLKCRVGCHRLFTSEVLEYHENEECAQLCKWNCHQKIGPIEKRTLHELKECKYRPMKCINQCGLELKAINMESHAKHYCRLALVECPNRCQQSVFRRELSQHCQPWHGSCPERLVRCPSNIVGWRIRFGNEEGIVMKYKRDEYSSSSEKSEKLSWNSDGIDKIYVRFSDRQEWIDYWASHITPLRPQKNSKEVKYACGWIIFSQLNKHLCSECQYREVLIGGNATTTSSNQGFLGQKTIAAEMMNMAAKRVEIVDLMKSKKLHPSCDYCSNEIPEELMAIHVNKECSHVMVRCSRGCGLRKMRKVMKEHVDNECPKRDITCEHCHEVMWAEEMSSHFETSCAYRVITCRNECGITSLQAKDEDRHLQEECPNRPYTCTCGTVYPICQKADHLVADCPKKLGLCPQGCGNQIPRDEIDNHCEFLCSHKHVFMNKSIRCPIGCGKRLKRNEELEHVTYYCQHRLTECPFQCGNTVKYDKLSEHVLLCPNRPICCEKGMISCQYRLYQWFCAPYEIEEGSSASVENDLSYQDLDDDDDYSGSASASQLHKPSHSTLQKSSMSQITQSFVGSGRVIRAAPMSKFSSTPLRRSSSMQRFTPSKSSNTATQLAHHRDHDDMSVGSHSQLSNISEGIEENESQEDLESEASSVSNVEGKLAFRDCLRLQSCPRHGRNLLMYAVKYGEYELAEYIIRKTLGEDLDVQNRYGETAMTLSCRLKRVEFVDLLIDNGADVNMETVTGSTPLIEATKSNCIPIVERLIAAGAMVKFKTAKHSKSALDWVSILKFQDLKLFLDIGLVVQRQIEEIFLAIARGDNAKVKELIKDGDFFSPNNTTRLHSLLNQNMDNLKRSDDKLKEMVVEFDQIVAVYEVARVNHYNAQVEEDTLRIDVESRKNALLEPRRILAARFERFDKAASTLKPIDVEELSYIRSPDKILCIVVLAFGLLFDVLDTKALDSYSLDDASMRIWWPIVIKKLSRYSESYLLMTSFSWLALQSPYLFPLGSRIRQLFIEFTHELYKRNMTNMGLYLHPTKSVKESSSSNAEKKDEKMPNEGKAKPRDHEDVEDKQEEDKPVAEIKHEDWDSDAEDAGDGYWEKGEWVPIIKKKKKWWDKSVQEETREEERVNNEDKKKKEKRIVQQVVRIGTPPTASLTTSQSSSHHKVNSNKPNSTNIQQDQGDNIENDDTNTINFPFVKVMAFLMSAVSGLMVDIVEIRKAEGEILIQHKKYLEAKSVRENLKLIFQTEKSKMTLFEKDLMDERKDNATYKNRVSTYTEKYRIASLLNRVTASGHTVISWAAAHGANEAVEELLSRGAAVGYNEVLIHASAEVIQCTFRLFYYHSRYFINKRVQARLESLDENILTARSHDEDAKNKGVEHMFHLKNRREKLMKKINIMRRKIRFPVAEAAYAGHYDIVMRIAERKLLHVNFMSSWCFPSPPTPRIRVHRRIDNSAPKWSFLKIINESAETFSSGLLVPGIGWVSRRDHRDVYRESCQTLIHLWNDLCAKADLFKEERRTVRVLVENKRAQVIYQQQMEIAIKSADFKKCIEMAQQDFCSIDYETKDGLTALIVAAEENVGGLHHDYILNDDEEPVLAVCYLLDRRFRAPAVNVETKFGNTPLLHACSLGREHCVEALLDRHAEINRQNKFGNAALHMAAKSGACRVVKLLLERGADPDLKNNEGRTPQDVALEEGFADVLATLAQFRSGYLGPVQVTRGRVFDKISCPMGCGVPMTKYEVDDHLLVCVLREVSCTLGCGNHRIVARELGEHLATQCPYRPIECEECHVVVKTCDLEKHKDYFCSHRNIMCDLEGCGSMIKACELALHRAHCLYKLMLCPENCGESYPIAKRLDHIRNHCSNRRISCPLRCTALVIVRQIPQHIAEVCSCRPMSCKWCQKSLMHKEWVKHEANCESRLVPCVAKCSEMVPYCNMETHLSTSCVHRFVPCAQHCPQKVRVIDMATHCKNQCEKRLVPCPNQCMAFEGGVEVPALIPYKQVTVHVQFSCPERTLRCAQCQETIRFKETVNGSHAKFHCLARKVECRIPGCLKVLPFKDRDHHELSECRHRLIICPNGCGLSFTNNKLRSHCQEICEMRYVSCILGCGEDIRYQFLADHMELDCPKRRLLHSRGQHRGGKQSNPSSPDKERSASQRLGSGGMAAIIKARSQSQGSIPSSKEFSLPKLT